MPSYQTGERLAWCPETYLLGEPSDWPWTVGTPAVPAASAKSNAVATAAVSVIFFMVLLSRVIFFMATSLKVTGFRLQFL